MRDKRCLFKTCFATLLLTSCLLLMYVADLLPFKPDWHQKNTQDGDYSFRTITIPTEEDLESYSHRDVAELYHRYINTVQVLCRQVVRIGQLGDGGWEMCEDKPYRPKPPCLIYSFGTGYDFSFDDHAADRYGCDVHSFDPSMTSSEGQRGVNTWFHKVGLSGATEELANGWQMQTLWDIQNQLGHTETTIDVLKVDIEEYEWMALPEIFTSGALANVKQLIIEMHISIGPEPMRVKYFRALTILKRLYDLGFRIFFTHRNLWCKFLSNFEGIDEVGCHEVSFIRVH